MKNRLPGMKRHQRGITLVELMVALAIGSFLIIGAVQIYNQSRQAAASQSRDARWLATPIRMA